MAKPKVLLLGIIEHAHDTWSALGDLAELITPSASNRKDFLKECQDGLLDGVVVCYRTFASVQIAGFFDQELVDVLPDSLKFICHVGAGYDQVDVQACSSRSISVSNTPTAVDAATADLAIFLLIGALRNFNAGMSSLRRGEWRGLVPSPASSAADKAGSQPLPMSLGHDPQSKVLGILGMGGIGKEISRRAIAFGMTIVYHNRRRLSESQERACGNAQYVEFDELLARSDVLSLNLPLNKHTRHILSVNEFAKMKDGVIIVNTARGAIIDEAALVDALDSGKVASCGLDVYENEPEIHPGLVANERAVLVPHLGTWTVETQTKMEETAIANVRSVLEHGKLVNIVPEQAS